MDCYRNIWGVTGEKKAERALNRDGGDLQLFPALSAAWWLILAKSLHCSMSGFLRCKRKTLSLFSNALHVLWWKPIRWQDGHCPHRVLLAYNLLSGRHTATTETTWSSSDNFCHRADGWSPMCLQVVGQGTIPRELLQWDTASPQLITEAKESLQAVQHEMCSAQRWKTIIRV